MIEFRLLGPVEVRAGDGPLALGRPQLRAVLAALAVDAGRPVPLNLLVERVWDGSPPRAVREVLYSHLTRIRRVLESVAAAPSPATLARRPGGYLLDVDPERVDLHRFRRLTFEAGDPRLADSARSELLTEALRLWRGTPLIGVGGQWAARARTGWQQQRLDTTVAWAQVELRLGRGDRVIATVRDLLVDQPLAEPLVGSLMQALVAAGRHAEALECFAAHRARLADELGTEPGSELRALHGDVLRGQLSAPDGSPARPTGPRPPAERASARPAQLPTDVRGFTGRQHELAELDALLDVPGQPATVVVSALSGTAGIGKTALAVHWAHRVADRFPDGQLYVNLRGFDPSGRRMEPADAIRLLLSGLEVSTARIPPDLDAQAALYRTELARRRVLLVLDNAGDAEQVRPLLPGGPAAHVLVTSRNQLTGLVAATGAHPLTLDLLPAAQARELLTGRLGCGRVVAEPEAVEQIITACARLPLALAIVAARAAQTGFPLAALAAELTDARTRLAALDAGDPATEVRAVFAWSYAALTAPAARLFRLLGLTRGPDIGLPAAASLAGVPEPEARELITELARGSLLTEHRPGRYAYHDLLAVYAADLSRATDTEQHRRAALGRLLDHYTHTAVAADRLLQQTRHEPALALTPAAAGTSPEQLADHDRAMAWLSTEHRNLLAALRQAADTGHDSQTWYLAWALDTYLSRQGHWHDRTAAWQLALPAAVRLAEGPAQANAHRLLAGAHTALGSYAEAHAEYELALDLDGRAGDLIRQGISHHNLGQLWKLQGRMDHAIDHAQRALDLFRAADYPRGQGLALNNIAWCEVGLGRHTQAILLCERSLAMLEELGDQAGMAATWDTLGRAHHELANYSRAADCYREALQLYHDLGDRYNDADTLVHLGDTHCAAGDPAAARSSWQQALDILTDLDHPDVERIRARLAALPHLTAQPS